MVYPREGHRWIEGVHFSKNLRGGSDAKIRIFGDHPIYSKFQAELYGLTNHIGENLTDLETIQQRYYYSLAELAVGGRCKCNGHAARCIFDKLGRYTCDCKHNTAGTDCEKCKPFHYDRPWARATGDDAHACVGRFSEHTCAAPYICTWE
jgi:hypothetical protein